MPPRVRNDSTWCNSTGTHEVTVTLEARTSGNYEVTFPWKNESGDWIDRYQPPEPDKSASETHDSLASAEAIGDPSRLRA